jgi:hypothetical protein
MNEPQPEELRNAVQLLERAVRRMVTDLIDLDPEPTSPEGKLLLGLADALAEYDEH